jgi:hypothetical protein
MTSPDPKIPPAAPEMAEKLAINRTGQLTAGQRRVVMVAGMVALLLLLCPLSILVQAAALVVSGTTPAVTLVGLAFTILFVLFILLFLGLIGTNAGLFLPDAFGQRPVRYVRGELGIHLSEKERPELPFSYVVEDYSFAPYVAPQDMTLRPGAPYLVYYSAHSRLLLSLAALDAPDAAQWEPQFENPPEKRA